MARFKVVGIKRWAGTMRGESKKIDSAKLFVEVKLDGSRNGDAEGVSQFAAGFCTEEIKLPAGELLKRVEHLPLPFYVELDLERVSNGKESKEVVIDLRPVAVESVKTPARAAG